ncbi:hypothetical protein D3C78_1243810 [compost metagenome]
MFWIAAEILRALSSISSLSFMKSKILSFINCTLWTISVNTASESLISSVCILTTSSLIFIWLMVCLIPSSMLLTRLKTSLVDAVDSSASLRTSCATTAKPLPCSPALAASIDAFRESKFVCSAISEIVVVIALIPCALRASSLMVSATLAVASTLRCMPSA